MKTSYVCIRMCVCKYLIVCVSLATPQPRKPYNDITTVAYTDNVRTGPCV